MQDSQNSDMGASVPEPCVVSDEFSTNQDARQVSSLNFSIFIRNLVITFHTKTRKLIFLQLRPFLVNFFSMVFIESTYIVFIVIYIYYRYIPQIL